jgi:hypothetical protein
MGNAIEPERYEEEQILEIPVNYGRIKCYVISGFADFTTHDTERDKSPIGFTLPDGSARGDRIWVTNQIHLVIGPDFNEVVDVSPTAAIAGYAFFNSDETDSTGIELEECRWDTVPVDGNASLERIRLKIKLRMCGGLQSTVTKISYHLVALVVEAET